MTASNIDIDQLINVLMNIRNHGTGLIDLQVLEDGNNSNINKLVIIPVKYVTEDGMNKNQSDIQILDPNINPENDDIFKMFDGI